MGGRGSKGKSKGGGSRNLKALQQTLDNAKSDFEKIDALENMPIGTTINMGYKAITTDDSGNWGRFDVEYQKVNKYGYKKVGGSGMYVPESRMVKQAKKYNSRMTVK